MAKIEVEEDDYNKLKKSVEKLEANNQKQKDELTAARKAKETAEADAKKAAEEAEAAAKAKAEENGDIDKIKEAHAKEIAKLTERVETSESKLSATLTDSAVTNAIAEAGIKENLRPAAAALIKTQNEIKLDDDGNVTIGGKSIVDHVKEWTQGDEGSGFVPSGNSGGGSSNVPGNSNPNGDGGSSSDVKPNFGGSAKEIAAAVKAKFGDQLKEAAN